MKPASLILLGAIVTIGFVTPAAAQESYIADLYGEFEVPGPGDSNGAGLATFDWNFETNELCYALAVDDIARATAAHVHRGATSEAGPPVATLETPGFDGGADGCLEISEELRVELRENPAAFYVNIHNDAYPAGAVRGQIER